jgi:twitching motility protein PilI
MAKKEALRELQTRLAEKLKAARAQERGKSWLAVESAGHGFLLPLESSGEIFPFGACMSVPYTQNWFLGVANLRGRLHGVIELSSFLGVSRMASGRDHAWLVALNASLNMNCALLFDKLAGLRNVDQLTLEPTHAVGLPPFVGGHYRDEANKLWRELSLAALVNEPVFLRIAA